MFSDKYRKTERLFGLKRVLVKVFVFIFIFSVGINRSLLFSTTCHFKLCKMLLFFYKKPPVKGSFVLILVKFQEITRKKKIYVEYSNTIPMIDFVMNYHR